MRFTVGGRNFDLTADDVRSRMKGVDPEIIQKHAVVINDAVYPPKQVFAVCLGFPRTSFTTMEAQRVLNRLGFGNRQARTATKGKQDEAEINNYASPGGIVRPIDTGGAVWAALNTLQLAVSNLDGRVTRLEGELGQS